MKTTKYILTAVAGVALSGCTSFSAIHDVNTMRATGVSTVGTPFTRALAEEYRVQVNDEVAEVEWTDASWFARKGLQASRGEAVLAVDVTAAPARAGVRYGTLGPVVQIPADRVPELSAAHGRLVAFLDGVGRDRQPVLAAHAQATYDCWVEEEWEKEADIACRTEFLRIQSQLVIVQTTTTSTSSTTSTAGTAKQTPFQVFFDFDRSNISDGAATILKQAADSSKQGNITRVNLTGHTDSSGRDDYNQGLSERRAEAVKQELIKDGVPSSEIISTGVGKAGQLVPTADGIREPQNRRTEIILQ